MRFVHGDELYVPSLQVVEETGKHQPLRRDIKQAKFVVVQTAQTLAAFVRREGGVKKCRRDTRRLQCVHLVFHQRDERRDDDREAIAHERR